MFILNRFYWQDFINQWKTRWATRIAWAVPRWLAYWCFIRVCAPYGQPPCDLREIVDAWEKRD